MNESYHTRPHLPAPTFRPALESLRSEFKWKHYLTFSWLLVLHLLNYGPGNLLELSRMSSAIGYCRLTRFFRASCRGPNRRLSWLGSRIMEQLPPPEAHFFERVMQKRGKF